MCDHRDELAVGDLMDGDDAVLEGGGGDQPGEHVQVDLVDGPASAHAVAAYSLLAPLPASAAQRKPAAVERVGRDEERAALRAVAELEAHRALVAQPGAAARCGARPDLAPRTPRARVVLGSASWASGGRIPAHRFERAGPHGAVLAMAAGKRLTPNGVAGGGGAELAAHAADAREAARVELREYVRVERVQLGELGRWHSFGVACGADQQNRGARCNQQILAQLSRAVADVCTQKVGAPSWQRRKELGSRASAVGGDKSDLSQAARALSTAALVGSRARPRA
eukprot:scaffold38602_cov69-Phaeocystis_antarctica.AAC.1